jgi:hypothetical protein
MEIKISETKDTVKTNQNLTNWEKQCISLMNAKRAKKLNAKIRATKE